MSLLSGRGVPVLMYHWVNPDLGDRLRLYGVTPGAFGRQIRRLRAAGYRSARFPELLRHVAGGAPLPPKSIVITLDDGYRDNLEYAGPILEEAGFTATIFLVTDRAGGINEWDLKHGDPPRPLLDWAAARRLDGGVFRFEPHSRTHPELTTVDPARAREEITGAKKAMEDQLGRRVSVFSYPHGSFHLGLEAIVREAGYDAAVTDLQGLNRRGTDPFRIRRTMITSRDFLAPYAFKVLTGFGVMGLGREMARRATLRPAAWEQAGFA
jgi:peptidoglycan/xylan/chitin deacetylase (PgdA/CDA1 family)